MTGLIGWIAEWRRERAASLWVVRMTGSDPGDYIEAYYRWRGADPRNAAAYDALARIWKTSTAIDPRRLSETPVSPRQSLGLDRAGRSIGRPGWVVATALIAVALSVAALLWSAPRASTTRSVIATVEPRAVRLADGSIAVLGSDSELAIDSSFVRRVNLVAGSVRLLVRLDLDHPFILQDGRTEVIARGDVLDAVRDHEDVRVQAINGSIETRTAAEPAQPSPPPAITLHSGETLRTTGATATIGRAPAVSPAWETQSIWFDALSLAEIIHLANVGMAQPSIRLAHATCGTKLVSGRFRLGPPPQLAEKLGAALGLRVDHLDGQILLDCP